MTGAHPRLLGVLGWPIAHSRSPAMHNAALAALGLDGELVYLPFAVAPSGLAAAVAGAGALGALGLNVTLPHKQAVLALSRPDTLALAVGAANTLLFEDAAPPRATNTDVHGFLELCAEAGARTDGRVVVLGAGGAARAVAAALLPRARSLVLISRSARPLEVAGERLAPERWEPATLARRFAEADLLVDTTPRGLDDAAPPLELGPLPASAVVLDLVARRRTRLCDDARARGLGAATGVAMLLHQGARSLELWTGRPAPLEIMRAALESALK